MYSTNAVTNSRVRTKLLMFYRLQKCTTIIPSMSKHLILVMWAVSFLKINKKPPEFFGRLKMSLTYLIISLSNQ